MINKGNRSPALTLRRGENWSPETSAECIYIEPKEIPLCCFIPLFEFYISHEYEYVSVWKWPPCTCRLERTRLEHFSRSDILLKIFSFNLFTASLKSNKIIGSPNFAWGKGNTKFSPASSLPAKRQTSILADGYRLVCNRLLLDSVPVA